MKKCFFSSLILSLLILFASSLFLPTSSFLPCYRLEYRVSGYNGYMVKSGSGSLNIIAEFFNPNSVDVTITRYTSYLPNGDFDLQISLTDPTKFTPLQTTTVLNTISTATFKPGISWSSRMLEFMIQDKDGVEVNHIPDGNYTISYGLFTFGFPLSIMFVSGEATYEVSDPDWESNNYTPVRAPSGQACEISLTSDTISIFAPIAIVLLASSLLLVFFLRRIKRKSA